MSNICTFRVPKIEDRDNDIKPIFEEWIRIF